jgi:hypothetical protein
VHVTEPAGLPHAEPEHAQVGTCQPIKRPTDLSVHFVWASRAERGRQWSGAFSCLTVGRGVFVGWAA